MITFKEFVEIDELTQAQRAKRGRVMRRNKAKLAAGRRRAKHRKDHKTLLKRAERRQRSKLRKKYSHGARKLSSSQKNAIERRMKTKREMIKRKAKSNLRR